jgi:hypothetical protein
MTKVFISYSRADSEFVGQLMTKLEESGIDTWVDAARLTGSEEWRRGIDSAINECFAVLVVMTPQSAMSNLVTYEWAYALGHSVPIVQLLLQPTQIPIRLYGAACVDFQHAEQREQQWQELINQLQEIQRQHQAKHSPQSRVNAIQALLQMGDTIATPVIMKSLQDPSVEVRKAAASALGTLRHEVAIDPLIQALADPDGRVRIAAAWALGDIGSPKAVPALIEALHSPDHNLRTVAVDALESIGTPEALAALEPETIA